MIAFCALQRALKLASAECRRNWGFGQKQGRVYAAKPKTSLLLFTEVRNADWYLWLGNSRKISVKLTERWENALWR